MPVHGKDSGVAIGSYELTRFLNEVSSNNEIDLAETSCFQEPGGAKTYTPGMRNGTGSLSGRWAGKPGGAEQVILGIQQEQDDANNSDGHPVTFAIDRGFRPGRGATLGPALSTGLSVSSPLADVVSLSGDLQVENGWRTGVILSPEGPQSATPFTSVTDQQAALTQFGASAHLHVVQNSRAAASSVTVQHSSDGTVWVDLLVFDSIPAGTISGQRKTTAAGVTVNRYLRAIATLGGTTGTMTFRVAAARSI
jgi:hypothetical protein